VQLLRDEPERDMPARLPVEPLGTTSTTMMTADSKVTVLVTIIIIQKSTLMMWISKAWSVIAGC
jgi:hypothetical protein